MVDQVEATHNFGLSSGRTRRSVRAQKYLLCGNTAILFCPSSNGKVFGVRIDAEDLPRVLSAGPWSVSNFYPRGVRLYAHSTRSFGGKSIYLHRFITNAPSDRTIEIDHQNNRTLDNRKSELRLVSKSVNQRNKTRVGSDNKFGQRGVIRTRSGRYSARVWILKKAKIIGTFDTPEQAGQAVRDFCLANGVSEQVISQAVTA